MPALGSGLPLRSSPKPSASPSHYAEQQTAASGPKLIATDGPRKLAKRKRRIPNHTLFEAYLQYCFSPKHTTGEQLLEVRRDKRERAAFAARKIDVARAPESEEEEDDDALDG
jgi:hypothetical protein